MLFTHNFSPHGSTLWNNGTITIYRRTLFPQTWYDKKIIFVADLMDDKGLIMKIDSFKEKSDIQCCYRVKYSKICNAIPAPLIQQIQNLARYSNWTNQNWR